MDYQEIRKASYKFEVKLIAFIEEYLKKYPTDDAIYKRYENGELLCIDYRTLEISMRNKSELERETRCDVYTSFYKNFHTYDMLHCTTDAGSRDEDKRTVKYQDTYGIASFAVEAYIKHNKIKDYWSLPAFLLPTPEEITAEKK